MYQFEIKNLATFIRRLNKLIVYTGHTGLRQELNTSSKDIYAMIDANFERGGPKSQKWEGLDPNTEIQRALEIGYYSNPHKTGILDWTGRLRRSLTGRGSFARKMIKYGCLELWVGSKHPLALTHHKGSSQQRGFVDAFGTISLRFFSGSTVPVFSTQVSTAIVTIPARPFWDKNDERMIMDKLAARAEKKINQIWKSG